MATALRHLSLLSGLAKRAPGPEDACWPKIARSGAVSSLSLFMPSDPLMIDETPSAGDVTTTMRFLGDVNALLIPSYNEDSAQRLGRRAHLLRAGNWLFGLRRHKAHNQGRKAGFLRDRADPDGLDSVPNRIAGPELRREPSENALTVADEICAPSLGGKLAPSGAQRREPNANGQGQPRTPAALNPCERANSLGSRH